MTEDSTASTVWSEGKKDGTETLPQTSHSGEGGWVERVKGGGVKN